SLPEDFKKIPPDHPQAHVLATVPGTREVERRSVAGRDSAHSRNQPQHGEGRGAVRWKAEFRAHTRFLDFVCEEYAQRCSQNRRSYYMCFQAHGSLPPVPLSRGRQPTKFRNRFTRSRKAHPSTMSPMCGSTSRHRPPSWLDTLGYYGAYVSGGVVVWGT